MNDAVAHERRKRKKRSDTLWVTDEELIDRSGVPPEIMRQLIQELDRMPTSGFPRKQKLYGDRRYMPSIQEYWAFINRLPQGRKSA